MFEIVVDSFAGGGGASLGIAQALGREPDVAINHDAAAIAMHAANHAGTKHFTEDIWKVSPFTATKGAPVGLLWSSPDCAHFSRAKGAKPVKKSIRSLAWIVVKWAAEVRPRVIILENVREFEDYGPLLQAFACKYSGPAEMGPLTIKCGWRGTKQKACPRCGSPVEAQVLPDGSPVLIPDPTRKGLSFKRWVGRIRNLGYEVQWRNLNASDYGAPTHRRRLFLIARCDGRPIVWPAPTHGDPKKLDDTPLFGRLQPWNTAASCIDWSIPCPSIFERKRPLAENTLRRIAMGIKRYVLDNPTPFIVQVNHGGPEFRGQDLGEPLSTVTGKHGYGVVTPFVARCAHGEGHRGNGHLPATEPLPTVLASKDYAVVAPLLARIGQTNGNGKYTQETTEPVTTVTSKAEHLLVTPVLVGAGGPARAGEPKPVDAPLGVVMAKNSQALVAATMVQTGYTERKGQSPRCLDLEKPLGTVVDGQKHAAVTAFLAKHYGGVVGHEVDRPIGTVTAWDHHSVVETKLAPCVMTNTTDHPGASAESPLPTQTTGNHHYLAVANLVRFNHAALVYSFLVKYFGTAIGANLIEPMHTATGKDRFGLVTVLVNGEPYVIVDIGMRMLSPRELARAQGFPDSYILTGSKSNQVARIGNSVAPVMAKVLVEANFAPQKTKRKAKVS